MNALDVGVPAQTIAEAAFARSSAPSKEQRVDASKMLRGPSCKYKGSKRALIEEVHDAPVRVGRVR